MPGPSSPDGVATRVSRPPSLPASVVDLLQRGVHAAELHGQRVRGVVAGVHQQPVQQLVDGVVAARGDADPGALGGRVLGGAADRPC